MMHQCFVLTNPSFLQCNRKEITSCTSPSRKNGRPVTSTSCLVPLVRRRSTFLSSPCCEAPLTPCPASIHSGNIQVSWVDDTSAFVSLSQTDQVQIGELSRPLGLKSRVSQSQTGFNSLTKTKQETCVFKHSLPAGSVLLCSHGPLDLS